MNKIDSVVIAGGGLAGATAAFSLRKLGFTGRVVLVSEEREDPYARPALSKEYLRGETGLDGVLIHPPAWYGEQRRVNYNET